MNSVHPEDLKIDFKKRIWSFHEWKDIPIGEGRRDLGIYNQSRWGVIGVYDHSIYRHVATMVHDAQEAIETPSHGYAASYD